MEMVKYDKVIGLDVHQGVIVVSAHGVAFRVSKRRD
jgi:hypothetical protein